LPAFLRALYESVGLSPKADTEIRRERMRVVFIVVIELNQATIFFMPEGCVERI